MEVELNDTLNKTWKQDKTGFGFRMLQKMGWKEDKGLGKNESGIVDNVKIQKRETGLGLGSQDIVDSANRGWSATATSFNDVLDVLKKNYKKKDEKKKSKAKKSAPVPTISVGMK
jgi:Pin2-interacting protein X1